MSLERERKEHPSYGMLYIGRGHCSNIDLVGSRIKHENYITLSIKRGVKEYDKNLNKEDFYARGLPLIEINMSPAQFAKSITSLNYGDGFPCTISFFEGEYVEPEHYESPKEKALSRFSEYLEETKAAINEKMEKICEELTEKNVTLTRRREMVKELKWCRDELASHIPWMARMFREELEKATVETQAEIEAQVNSAVTKLGIEKLNERLNSGEDLRYLELNANAFNDEVVKPIGSDDFQDDEE